MFDWVWEKKYEKGEWEKKDKIFEYFLIYFDCVFLKFCGFFF